MAQTFDLRAVFGRNLRAARTAADLTQSEVAERLKGAGVAGHVNQAVVSRWESGVIPHPETLAALASVLGVPVASLFQDEAVKEAAA